MGWTFCSAWTTKGSLVKELLGPGYHTSVAHKVVGNNLWCVKSYVKDGRLVRYVALFLLERHSGEWGYKDLDESCGPYECDCPLEFLTLADTEGPAKGYARDFRERVLKHHNVPLADYHKYGVGVASVLEAATLPGTAPGVLTNQTVRELIEQEKLPL